MGKVVAVVGARASKHIGRRVAFKLRGADLKGSALHSLDHNASSYVSSKCGSNPTTSVFFCVCLVSIWRTKVSFRVWLTLSGFGVHSATIWGWFYTIFYVGIRVAGRGTLNYVKINVRSGCGWMINGWRQLPCTLLWSEVEDFGMNFGLDALSAAIGATDINGFRRLVWHFNWVIVVWLDEAGTQQFIGFINW